METINERLKCIIDTACHGNKSAFARAIGITPAYAAQLYSAQRDPSDRTISDICRVFNVREEWLRDGLEPMRAPKSREEEVAELVGRAFSDDNEFQQAVIRMICSRTKDELKVLENAFRTVCDQIQKEDRGE